MSFYTEVICKSPLFDSKERVHDLELLEPVTRAGVQAILEQAQALYGIKLMAFETYRSEARQLEMFNQGASKLKKVGVHHFGLACDLVRDVNGQPSWKGDFSFLGQLAKANNLIWGGDWGHPQTPSTFHDNDHVQRCTVADQPGLFAINWYPDGDYNPYKQHVI
jgi:hypothetical protein